jgi:hypothetical protein
MKTVLMSADAGEERAQEEVWSGDREWRESNIIEFW